MSILGIFVNLPGKERFFLYLPGIEYLQYLPGAVVAFAAILGEGVASALGATSCQDLIHWKYILSIFRQGLIWFVKCLGVFFFRILTTEIQNIPASVYFAAIATLILKVESEKSKYHELQQKITLAVLQSVCKFKKDE